MRLVVGGEWYWAKIMICGVRGVGDCSENPGHRSASRGTIMSNAYGLEVNDMCRSGLDAKARAGNVTRANRYLYRARHTDSVLERG